MSLPLFKQTATSFHIQAILCALVCIFSASIAVFAEDQQEEINYWDEFEIRRTIELPGDANCTQIVCDESAQKLFVVSDDKLEIFDSNSMVRINELEGLLQAHDVVHPANNSKVYVTCEKENCVRIIDLQNGEKSGHINTGRSPQRLCLEPTTNNILALNSGEHTLTVISPQTGRNTGQIKLAAEPVTIVTDATGSIYLACKNINQLLVIRANDMRITRSIQLDAGVSVDCLAFDKLHHIVFCTSGAGKLSILNAENGKLIRTIDTGTKIEACIFDPKTQNLFCASGASGTMTVVHEGSPTNFAIVQSFPTLKGSQSLSLSPAKSEIWLSNSSNGRTVLMALGKHIPVDDGVPFSIRRAAYMIDKMQNSTVGATPCVALFKRFFAVGEVRPRPYG